jgi:RNA polymerase sigma factor (sigma-70 family)
MGDVARIATGPRWSRRVLALASDKRLVDQVRRGHEAAFEVVFERHGPAILAFCRHMLGSPEEAEDAVQHTFAAAYRDLARPGEREIVLKPWLFAIARNRCISLLRARREQPTAELDGALATVGLAEEVEQRAELRRLLADVADLPDEQRAALLLTEVGDLSHAEVADVLGCEVARVKALVFRARSGLIARRDARDTPCEIVREQVATLRGGSLRRTEIRLHLRDCPGCRAYREQVRQQRQMLAVALPVAPTLGLKSSVLAAIGLGGGTAGGITAAGGGVLGGATIAKVALVGVLAGGVVAGEAVVDSGEPVRPVGASGASVDGGGEGGAADAGAAAPSSARTRSSAGVGRLMGSDELKTRATPSGKGGSGKATRGKAAPGQAKPKRGRRLGQERGRRRGHERKVAGGKPERGQARGGDRGRGPIEAPPAETPVKRGPPPKPEPPPAPAVKTEPKVKTQAAQPAPAPPPELEIPEPPKLNGKSKR